MTDQAEVSHRLAAEQVASCKSTCPSEHTRCARSG